ncbi:MAG: START domain-containing protein [Ferruginibacter sp.]
MNRFITGFNIQLRAFVLCTLFLSPFICFSQKDWTLKVDKEGIKIYTKITENSPFKAVKTTCTIDAPLSRVAAVLMDINSTADWVYATKKCSVLKQVSASELIYYSEVEAPWPVSNRDFIVRLWITQDAKTKTVSVLSENKPDHLPENKGIVRIRKSHSQWTMEPLPNGQVKVEFMLQVDPGGSLPAWIINMFATKGPFESFKKLREQVKKDKYKTSLPFIKD